jgi:hypothetical protein
MFGYRRYLFDDPMLDGAVTGIGLGVLLVIAAKVARGDIKIDVRAN